MANVKKALVALNDVLDVPVETALNGAVGIEYGTKGADGVAASTGTIVLEASISGVTYYPLQITNNLKVDVSSLSAAGLGYAEVPGWLYVRARMSAAGGVQGVMVYLNEKAG